MADKSLTPKDMLSLVINIVELVRTSTHHRVDLFERDQITKAQFEFISNSEGRLLNVANQAANSAIKEIITDLNDAAQVLTETTADLQTVIEQLKSFDKFIKTLANLTNIFSRISQAIAGGTSAIISTLVQELNNIGSRGIDDSSIAGQIDEI